MHEWALAEAVVAGAAKAAEKERLKEITGIVVVLGELQQIEVGIFEYALKEVLLPQSKLLSGAKIKIEIEVALLQCRVCREEWPFREALRELGEDEAESIHFIPEVAQVYLRCPQCGSPDFEVTQGRGVRIESIRGLG
jgi:hydrogenase nickel incorporation protein HypA/HybF